VEALERKENWRRVLVIQYFFLLLKVIGIIFHVSERERKGGGKGFHRHSHARIIHENKVMLRLIIAVYSLSQIASSFGNLPLFPWLPPFSHIIITKRFYDLDSFFYHLLSAVTLTLIIISCARSELFKR
jgi:hypothetical protein